MTNAGQAKQAVSKSLLSPSSLPFHLQTKNLPNLPTIVLSPTKLSSWLNNSLLNTLKLEQWHNCSVRTPIQFPHNCRYRKGVGWGLPGTCSSQRDAEPSLPFQATSPFYSQNRDFVRTFWVNIFSLASSCTAGFQGEKLWRNTVLSYLTVLETKGQSSSTAKHSSFPWSSLTNFKSATNLSFQC